MNVKFSSFKATNNRQNHKKTKGLDYSRPLTINFKKQFYLKFHPNVRPNATG